MTYKTKTKAEIAARRQATAQYYLMRVDQVKIAELLTKSGIETSQSTVSRDIKFLIDQWKEESKAVIEDLVAREAAELNVMEMEAANNYNKSKGRKSQYEGDPGVPADPQQMEKWLNIRLKIKERRAKMLGLDGPQKIEMDANLKHTGELDVNLTEEELQKEIDDDLQKLIAVGYIPDPKKNIGEPTETIEN